MTTRVLAAALRGISWSCWLIADALDLPTPQQLTATLLPGDDDEYLLLLAEQGLLPDGEADEQ